MFIVCTNGGRPVPVSIAATADLGRPQQEVASGASDTASGVQCVVALVGAVLMAVQGLGGRQAFHLCLARVSFKARLTKAGDVIDGFTTTPSVAPRLIALSLVTDWVLQIAALLVVPLAPCLRVFVDVELHAKLVAVVVVGLVGGPRPVAFQRAVIPHPGPRVALLALGDPDPVVGGAPPVGQNGDQVLVLRLVLDDHHVRVHFPAPRPGLGPVLGLCAGVIRPAVGAASQVTYNEEQCALHSAWEPQGSSQTLALLF